MNVTTEPGFRKLTAPSAPTRAQIAQFEAEVRALPQLDLPPEHGFGPGFYTRTLRIPAGAHIVGKTHAKEHIFILSKGEMLVATVDGRRHVKAPFQAVCRAGLKRVGYALTDCIGTNVHLTDETDLERLEAELILPEALTYVCGEVIEGKT